MSEPRLQPRLDAPFVPLNEFALPQAAAVPALVLQHRKHHGAPVLVTSRWAEDRSAWPRMPVNQAGVFVHALTRLSAGMEVALQALPILARASLLGQRGHSEQYQAIDQDTRYIVDACRRYRGEVAQKDDDPVAQGGKFEVIFQQIFPARVQALERSLASAGSSRVEQIRVEARLRSVYHVIGEGLGAISAIWGLNAAMRELAETAQHIELPGLARLVGDLTLIERRHIAFGLAELGELARERYFPTVLAVVREFKQTKPLLDQMRIETFQRWGSTFPFAIDREQLAALAKQRVVGWLGGHVFSRPSLRQRKQLASLGEIV